MSYRLCGRNEAQNSRSDPYADGIHKKLSIHKCQKLAILDRTLLSIRQGPTSSHPYACDDPKISSGCFSLAKREPYHDVTHAQWTRYP